MHARIEQVFLHGDVSVFECQVSGFLVACLPREDVVVMFALAVCAIGFTGQVFTQYRCIRQQCLERVDDDRQFFVFDFNGFDGVSGNVAVFCNDDGNFLHLEVDFFVGQNGGDVAGQCWHPVQLQRLQVVGGQNRDHAGNGECAFFVNALDACVRQRRTNDVHVQHARHFHVVDVIAFALNETRVFLAQA